MSNTKEHEFFLIVSGAMFLLHTMYFSCCKFGIVMLWSGFFYFKLFVMFFLFSHDFVLMVFFAGLCVG